MPNTKTYTGGCHCGRVRYEATTDLGMVVACNCSICQKSGTLLTFVSFDNFNLLSGEEALKDYRFNKHNIAHLFCEDCGVKSFARGKVPNGPEMVAVNVRCLDDIDISTLTPKQVNGREF